MAHITVNRALNWILSRQKFQKTYFNSNIVQNYDNTGILHQRTPLIYSDKLYCRGTTFQGIFTKLRNIFNLIVLFNSIRHSEFI